MTNVQAWDEVVVESLLRRVPLAPFTEWLWALERGEAAPPALAEFVVVGAQLEWLRMERGRPTLTAGGFLGSQALREFWLWERRGRRLHAEGDLACLRREAFRGQRVLEVGCGSGINLCTLQPVAAAVLGIEVEPALVAVGRALARLVGVPVPPMRVGRGEATGLASGSFDRVLMFGSLQYMEIEAALREAKRLLAPGGLAIFVLGEWGHFLANRVRQERWRLLNPRRSARLVQHLVGSAVYPWVGRALLRAQTPIHPTAHRMRVWMARAGLVWDGGLSGRVGGEMCYVGARVGEAEVGRGSA